MDSRGEPARLAGVELGPINHACMFFHTREEEYRTLLPFVKQGIDKGERAVHIVNPQTLDEHLRRLQNAGIPVAEAERGR